MSQHTVGSESQTQSTALEEPASSHHLDRSLLMVVAVACGVFVSNVYYNQPLLELLQQAFPRAVGLVNLVPTATQLGFACGLFFLVPLGDRIDRRKLILGQAAVLIVVLGAFASAAHRHKLRSPHTASLMQVTSMRANLLGMRAASVGFRTRNYSPAAMAFGGRRAWKWIEVWLYLGRWIQFRQAPFIKLNVPKGAT
jgi:MFS family permease